jgi:hypothetical protein
MEKPMGAVVASANYPQRVKSEPEDPLAASVIKCEDKMLPKFEEIEHVQRKRRQVHSFLLLDV